MGGCSSKRTRTGTYDSYGSRQESVLNSRAYKTTNPTTVQSTTTTKKPVSQTRPIIQKQQHCEVRNLENGAKKTTLKNDVTTSRKPSQFKLNNNSFAKPSTSATAPEVKAPFTKQCHPILAERRVLENTSHCSENKMNINTRSIPQVKDNKQTMWDVGGKTVIIENSALKSKKYDEQNKVVIKNNAAVSFKKRKPNKFRNMRPNNHVAKTWRTRKDNRNDSYIDRKDLKEFFELMKCPVCYQRIHGRIQKCVEGHFICITCRSKLDIDRCPVCQSDMSNERMVTLENMIGIISMPCPYQKFGCSHTVNPMQMQQHMEECPYGVISCVDARCSWEGKLEHIAYHFAGKHRGNVVQKGGELPSTKEDYTHTYLLRFQYRHNFFCRFKVCNAGNALSIAVQGLSTPGSKMEKWSYQLTLFTDIKRTIYTDLKVHEFKNTDSLNLIDKSLILPLNEVELLEVDGLIKWKIWFTNINSESAKSAIDGYCGVRNVPAEGKMKSDKCGM